MDQPISGPIISFLTEEPSPHFCGDGADGVWQFHHSEELTPFRRASTTPNQGSGHSWGVSQNGSLNVVRTSFMGLVFAMMTFVPRGGLITGYSVINLGSHFGMAGAGKLPGSL